MTTHTHTHKHSNEVRCIEIIELIIDIIQWLIKCNSIAVYIRPITENVLDIGRNHCELLWHLYVSCKIQNFIIIVKGRTVGDCLVDELDVWDIYYIHHIEALWRTYALINYAFIGSGNGLSSVLRQAITWTMM